MFVRLSIGMLVAAALYLSGASIGEAATYEVRACDAAPTSANNSWNAVRTAPVGTTSIETVCPSPTPDPYGEVAAGLSVMDTLEGDDAPADGSFSEWRITAPTQTKISAFAVTRDIGNRATLQGGAYTPYGRVDGSDLAGESCYRPNGEFFCRIQGAVTQPVTGETLAWGIRCSGTTFCHGGFSLHEVWVAIRSAIVTIDDPVAPLIGAASGELADGAAWHAGVEQVTVAGSDVTGVRQVGAFLGATQLALKTAPNAAAGGCGQLNQGLAYTYTTPCAGARGLNAAQTLDVDTASIPDGSAGSVRLVVRDTAGNEAESSLPVKVDNEAPGAPEVTSDSGWSREEQATWSWAVAAETDRAPIVGIEVEKCLVGGSCETENLPGAAFGAPVSLTRVVGEGETSVRVRHRDSAGNVGAFSVARTARRDRTAPSVTIELPRREVAPGETIDPVVQTTDPLSGVASVEKQVRVNGGEWQPLTGPVSGTGGTVFVFRARAIDQAGNASAWVESAEARVVAPAFVAPTPTPAPTTTPTPPAVIRSAVKLVGLKATWRRGKLTIAGRISAATATGDIRMKLGRRLVRARVLRGKFVLRARTSKPPRRLSLRYLGDRTHAPAQRVVTVRRRA
jgi:hypothetical protein